MLNISFNSTPLLLLLPTDPTTKTTSKIQILPLNHPLLCHGPLRPVLHNCPLCGCLIAQRVKLSFVISHLLFKTNNITFATIISNSIIILKWILSLSKWSTPSGKNQIIWDSSWRSPSQMQMFISPFFLPLPSSVSVTPSCPTLSSVMLFLDSIIQLSSLYSSRRTGKIQHLYSKNFSTFFYHESLFPISNRSNNLNW